MALRMPARFRGDQQCLAAEIDRFAGRLLGQLEIHERNITRSQEPPVDGAEVDHHAVVRLSGGISELDRPALIQTKISQAPGRKNQLACEAEIVECPGTILAPEGPVRFVVLAQEHVAVRAGTKIGILVHGASLLYPTGVAR